MLAIHGDGGSSLRFDLQDDRGVVLLRSGPFSSICRLEAALGALHAATKPAWNVKSASRFTAMSVGPARRRIWLVGTVTTEQVDRPLALFRTLASGTDAPAGRRRQDLSGMRCDHFE